MKKNTIRIISATLAVLLIATGCTKVAKLENGQDAVVSLKNGKISVDSLYNKMKSKYALSVLIDEIDSQILNEKYKDNKEIDEKVDKQIEAFITQYANGKEEDFLKLAQQNWGVSTMEEVKELIKLSFLRDTAITDYAKDQVTEKEKKDYYEKYIFGDISAKHILIQAEVSSNATDAEKKTADEKALKTAKEVIKKLEKGEDWDKLAKSYSADDSNKNKGGLLGDFVHGDMVTEFEEAAKKLEVGKYTTTPVKTSYGYHIIYKVSQKETPEYSVVESDITDQLANEKLNSDNLLSTTALEELRKEYKIDIQDSELKTQYENYLESIKEQAKAQ